MSQEIAVITAHARPIGPNIRKTKWRDKQWAGPIPEPREPKE